MLAMTKVLYVPKNNVYTNIMKEFKFYVYIMANKRNGTLYVGITNDLFRRIQEHKKHINPDAFTAKYNCDKLVYYEEFQYANRAIDREKQLKGGSRTNKIALIESINPDWMDLSEQDMFWL